MTQLPERLFHLQRDGAFLTREVLGGVTTFLTMAYILLVNPSIAAEAGMPPAGVFAATALTAAFCSLLMGLAANVPFAMGPGMGLNTLIIGTICLGMGFHWKEALAITFLSGLAHVAVMLSPLRGALFHAIPEHLKIAIAASMGLFIAYIGISNADLLVFFSNSPELMPAAGEIADGSFLAPGLAWRMSAQQLLACGGLLLMICLLALGAKNKENYAALPVGILLVTFLSIPLHISELNAIGFGDMAPFQELGQIFLSCFGRPGLLSLADSPAKLASAGLACLMVLLTSITDSIASIIGIGQMPEAHILEDVRPGRVFRSRRGSRLDRAFVCNAMGGGIAAIFGTTTGTTYIESITGILSGGRTGLSACVTGLLFLLCLPLAGFFSVLPPAASAPALVVAGSFMLPLLQRIHWKNFEESCPAFMTIFFLPLSGNIMNGVIAGIVTHIVIQIAMGKGRAVHPVLYVMTGLFLLILLCGG